MAGKDLRLGKLFNKGENAVIVAIDHGMFDGPIPGMIDAGFMRLKNLQVGYTFPSTLLPKSGVIDRVRIYVSATNVFTITDYKGIDPENDFNPPTRQLMFGLNAAF